jgi:hypothetical protein
MEMNLEMVRRAYYSELPSRFESVFVWNNVTGSFLAHKYWKGEASPNLFWEYLVKLPVKL